MRKVLLILIIISASLSCKKDKIKAGDTVEFYLLKTYQVINRRCQIDPSATILRDTAMIRDQDIIQYSQNNYEFTLSNAAIEKVKTLKDQTPFAVTVDKQVVYYGFFKPSYSSSSCDYSITMDIAWTFRDKISLRLGYPGVLDGITIDDQRNHPKLVATLRKQGKLK